MCKFNYKNNKYRIKKDINEYLINKSVKMKISKHEIEKKGLTLVWTYRLLILLNIINLFGHLHNFLKKQFIFIYITFFKIDLYQNGELDKISLDEIDIKAIDFLHFCSLVLNFLFYILIYYFISYQISILFLIFSTLIFVNIIFIILRLHLLSKRYIPFDIKRAILLWFLNIVNINISFSVFYIYFHNGFNKNILVSLITPIYFSFITFATIGYGDFVPVSEVIKMIVIFQIIIAYIMLIIIIQDIIGARETRSNHKSIEKES